MYSSHYDYNTFDTNSDSDSIEEEMLINLYENPINREALTKIPGTNTYVNSVNVFVGRQRTGKTYTAIKEIIKISRNHPQTHLLVYINKDGKPNDDTFERTKDLINCSIIYVSYDNSKEYLKQLLEYKHTYNIIKDKHLENELPQKHMEELAENLSISDLSNEYLHTIILLEDATQFMKSKNAEYINDLMTKCRHIQCSFFVIIHFWKALSTNLKSNLSTIYIFSGYSKQQLSYILYQINLNESLKDIYDKYKLLSEHGKLIIDSNICSFQIDF